MPVLCEEDTVWRFAKNFYRILLILPLKNPIYRGTSPAEQINHSARAESPDEWALSVKKTQFENPQKSFYLIPKKSPFQNLIDRGTCFWDRWVEPAAVEDADWGHQPGVSVLKKFFLFFFQKHPPKKPRKNPIYRGTFICGSCARHDVVEDTGRGQQSVKQVFQLFSKDGCEMTSEKS